MVQLESGKRIFYKMIAYLPMFSIINDNHFGEQRAGTQYLRDSISIYFEQCENNDENNIKFNIYRVYYNYNEYYKFILSGYLNNDIKKLNFKSSPFSVTKEELIELIQYMKFGSNPKNRIIAEVLPDSQSLKRISEDDLLETLNNAFYKYYYDCIEANFKYDETTRQIDFLFNEYIQNHRHEDFDYRPGRYMDNIDYSDDYSLRVFDVGQGNCSALIKYKDESKTDYEVIMVFDFGLQSKRKNSALDEMISKIDYQTKILISHFDMDHINNVITRTDLTTPWWIFPKYHGTGVKANKFFAVLLKVASHKTFSGIVPKYGGYLDLSDNIKIYQTIGKMDPNQSTKANAECLVTTIKSRKNNVLIPADSLYQEFDSRILETHYDYVLIPHHCCKYDTSLIRDIPKINSVIDENTKGIVLSGRNSFGHANYNHLLRYQKKIVFLSSKIYDDFKNDITSKCKIKTLGKKYIEIEL